MGRLAGAVLLWLVLAVPTLANVLCVQHGLNQLGYTAGASDGDIGNKTKAAAKAFAKDTANSALPELSAETSPEWCQAIKQTLGGNDRANARSVNGIYDFELDITTPPTMVLSGDSLEQFWHMHETAKKCLFEVGRPADNDTPHLSLPKVPAATYAAVTPQAVFTPAQQSPTCVVREPLTARLGETPWDNAAPEPLIGFDAKGLAGFKASGARAGEDSVNFAGLWFATTQARATLQPDAYRRQLIDVLADWAKADALQRVQQDGGKSGPVIYAVTTAIATMLNSYVSTAMHMSPEERALIGPWLQRTLQKIAGNPGQRQSNQVIGFSLMLATWGLSTGNVTSVQWAIDNYKRAIHEMRPDGSFPRDSSRGGSGLSYQNLMTGNMVLLGALLERSLGVRLLDYAVDGRSIHNAVAYNLAAMADPVTYNKKYAVSCPGLGDTAVASVDSPAIDFGIETTFAISAYLPVYALLRPDTPASTEILGRFVKPVREAVFHPVMGAAPLCVLGLDVPGAEPVDLASLPDPAQIGSMGLATRTIEVQANPLEHDKQFNSLLRTVIRGERPGFDLLAYNFMGGTASRTSSSS